MRHQLNRLLIFVVSLLALNGLFLLSLAAQTENSSTSARATRLQIRDAQVPLGGKLFVTVRGRERKIYDEAFEAWIIDDGRQVVFSSHDGSGGFENEGQSLRIYDVATRSTQKILSEYTGVTAVQPIKVSTGATALLVKLQDGGLGGSYFAVVDPKRGEVFYRQWAEATEINGDNITLAFYREEDWDAINDARGWKPGPSNQVLSTTKVAAYKTEKHDLKEVLKSKVINNRPSNLDEAPARMKEVKIYLWEVNSNRSDLGLSPVTRQVNAYAPLRPALESLFAGASKEEEGRGLISSTFGMKFAGVTLTNGTALVRFSQPRNQTNYGSQGPLVFIEAIEKTARQFPTVKKVVICAVGETLIDGQLEKRFPRCPR